MNITKFIIILLTIIIGITLFLSMITLLLKKFKANYDEDGKLKLSFSIWFSSLFFSSILILAGTFSKALEIVDNLLKMQPDHLYFAIGKSLALVICISILWFLLWYFTCKFLIVIIVKDIDDEVHMAADNYGYFIIKGILLLGILVASSILLDAILRFCVPSIEIPVFH